MIKSTVKSSPDAILFDWDNTLVDTWPVITEALNAALSSFDQEPWSLDEARKRVRLSMRDSFPKLFGEKWEDAAKIFYEHYGKIHKNFVKPIDGIPEMLEELHRSDIYLSVVSNKCGVYLRREVQHLHWAKYFKKLVGATQQLESVGNRVLTSMGCKESTKQILVHFDGKCPSWSSKPVGTPKNQ